MTDAKSDLQSGHVLYWPGLKRDPGELEHLWPLLKAAGVTPRWLEPDYDVGPAHTVEEISVQRDLSALLLRNAPLS